MPNPNHDWLVASQHRIIIATWLLKLRPWPKHLESAKWQTLPVPSYAVNAIVKAVVETLDLGTYHKGKHGSSYAYFLDPAEARRKLALVVNDTTEEEQAALQAQPEAEPEEAETEADKMAQVRQWIANIKGVTPDRVQISILV